MSKAIVIILELCISVLETGFECKVEAWDLLVGAFVFGFDYMKLHIIKRMQFFRKENNQRSYFTPMIVFTGLVSFVLDVALLNRFLNIYQAVGCLVFLAGLAKLHWHELWRYSYCSTCEGGDKKEEMLPNTS